MPSNLMFFLIFVSSFFYLILDSIPFFPPFFLFFSFFSFSFFSFFFSFLDTEYNPTSTPPEPLLAHCLCWWVFWLGLLVVFWFRKNFKTLVILWFLFVYSPIKLSKRRITLLTIFSITLGLAGAAAGGEQEEAQLQKTQYTRCHGRRALKIRKRGSQCRKRRGRGAPMPITEGVNSSLSQLSLHSSSSSSSSHPEFDPSHLLKARCLPF